jgi:thiol-disulfide isomerase/thioredoxin
MNRRHLLATSAVLGLTSLGVYNAAQNEVAPLSTFVLLDGTRRSSTEFKGRVTLVNFWATSCLSCVAEMPMLASTYERYRDRGFDTIAVAMHYDPPSYVVSFANSRQLPFPVAIDNTGEVARQWGDVALTPTTYLVDQGGRIVKRYVGAPDFAQLDALIERLLA